ncbi:MAG: hypothetical protein OXR66_06490 [Candidatus Woesearchaeota archaeon]|nr:hypothetical protein [Candidatus Woesearchaeota archaeon]
MEEKDLSNKTYSSNIRSLHIPRILYRGARLHLSKAAEQEMHHIGLEPIDCKQILETGYPSPRKRGKHKEEKWFDKGRKTFNVVVVRSFNHLIQEEVFVVTHVGVFTKKRMEWNVSAEELQGIKQT